MNKQTNFLSIFGLVGLLIASGTAIALETVPFAPVSLNTKNKNMNHVIRGSYLVNVVANCGSCHVNYYGKHHAGYVTNLNNAIKGTKYEKLTLEKIIRLTYGQFLLSSIYNNAAQTWNHTFYWNSLKPNAGDKVLPTGKLLSLINAQFGHFSNSTKDEKGAWTNPGFKQKLFDAAKGHFGSGWVWVALNKQNKLEILATKNADSPLPLLVIDVWEHAYYLDYQNGRAGYLTALLDNIINWEFAENNLPSTLKV